MKSVTTYYVRVKDVWCSVKGDYAEECETTSEEEANTWYNQWKREYLKKNGYEGFKVSFVTVTKMVEETVPAVPALQEGQLYAFAIISPVTGVCVPWYFEELAEARKAMVICKDLCAGAMTIVDKLPPNDFITCAEEVQSWLDDVAVAK
jgi:hypothetical protein